VDQFQPWKQSLRPGVNFKKPFRPKFADKTLKSVKRKFIHFLLYCFLEPLKLRIVSFSEYVIKILSHFFGWNFIWYAKTKICPKTFRPKRSFIKSIPEQFFRMEIRFLKMADVSFDSRLARLCSSNLSWDRCYDFLNIFSPKIGKNRFSDRGRCYKGKVKKQQWTPSILNRCRCYMNPGANPTTTAAFTTTTLAL
jgi:hypothetical protein